MPGLWKPRGLRKVIKRERDIWTLKCGHTMPAPVGHPSSMVCPQCRDATPKKPERSTSNTASTALCKRRGKRCANPVVPGRKLCAEHLARKQSLVRNGTLNAAVYDKRAREAADKDASPSVSKSSGEST